MLLGECTISDRQGGKSVASLAREEIRRREIIRVMM